MAKFLTITRREIVKALRTEPLRAGMWVGLTTKARNILHTASHSPSANYGAVYRAIWDRPVENKANCTVCAVGAVLRTRLAEGISVDSAGTYISGLVNNSNPELEKLSQYFEETAGEWETFTKARREKLVRWVRKNIPAEFSVRIPQYLSRKWREA